MGPILKLPSVILRDQIVDWFDCLRGVDVNEDIRIRGQKTERALDLLYPKLQEIRVQNPEKYRTWLGILALNFAASLAEEVDFSEDVMEEEEVTDEIISEEEAQIYEDEALDEASDEMHSDLDSQISFFEMLRDGMTLQEIENYVDERPEILSIFMERTICRSFEDLYTEEANYELFEKNHWMSIYERLNPFHSMEQFFRKVNNLTDPATECCHQLLNYYQTYLAVSYEREDVIDQIVGFIFKKYKLGEQNLLFERMLSVYYYYTKGQEFLDRELVDDYDLNILKYLECQSKEVIFEQMRHNKNLIHRIVDRYCYYYDHMAEENNVKIHQVSQEKQYMKKFYSKIGNEKDHFVS